MAARLNFMALDRADVQYAVKEACRSMAKPTEGAWRRLKRLVRYVAKYPRVTVLYKWQQLPTRLVVFGGSDWAGCKATCKPTGGGVMMFGEHCLRSWSSTQSVVSQSSAEAEYYASRKAASVGLGMRSLSLIHI